MKRLKKKASVTLSHSTTFEKFINICNEGGIKPFSQSGNSQSNSQDINSIYLTRDSGWSFAMDFIDDDKYSTSVCLNINVNEDGLLPSHDIFEYEVLDVEKDDNGEEYVNVKGREVNLDDLTWKDTLDLADECRYNGEISLSSIESVTFFTRNNKIKSLLQNNKTVSIDEAKKIVDEFLKSS